MSRVRVACYALIVLGGVACGDNTPVNDVFVPTSGSRLALQWYRYDDGTQEPDDGEFYDAQLHVDCRPALWSDDVVRCVPVVDDAVYVDAACEQLVGRAVISVRPRYFLAHAWDGTSRPTGLFRAGPETTPITQYYELREGACVGPLIADAVTYYEVADEVLGADLVPVRDGEIGDGRLGLRVHETDDGVQVPFGVHDRDLDVDCAPVTRAGGATCEPTTATRADYFRDPGCVDPAVVVDEAEPGPTIASVVDPESGCAAYRAIGEPLGSPVYRRDAGACVAVVLPAGLRALAVAAPVALPAIERTIEDVAERRLQRILVSDGAIRFADDRLLDTATRGECRRHALGDTTRCIPAAVATGTSLFTAGCVVEVLVAELPEHACDPVTFATVATAVGIDVHAIGDPVTGLYRFDGWQCLPYTAAPGTVVRALGPPIDPEAFMAAVYFGER